MLLRQANLRHAKPSQDKPEPLPTHTHSPTVMLTFCPFCGGLLLVSSSSGSGSGSRNDSSAFKCRTCAYTFPVPEGVAYASRVELKRKTVDDVLGGEDAWKNVDSTDGNEGGEDDLFLMFFILLCFALLCSARLFFRVLHSHVSEMRTWPGVLYADSD